MPKRSAQEKLERYRKKIRKLEEKEKENKTCRIRRQALNSSDDEINEDTNTTEYQDPIVSQADDPSTPQNEATPATQEQDLTTPPEPSKVSLDPELLSALGASTSDTPEYGTDLHDSLTKLWTPILKKGLPKDEKDKLSKEYLLPNNCKLLQAPKLNAEISAAVADVVRGRDKKLEKFQQQLGVGTAAVSRGLDTLLTSSNKKLAVTQLSDGCRFLTDLHYLLSKDRIKLVTPSLDKNFLTVIQDAERDETLFGNILSDKIKASQAINKQSSQIKASSKKTTGSTSSTQPLAVRPTQGNWTGPPRRFLSNRGGRGGHQRSATTTPRRNYPQSQTQLRNASHPKTRAPQ